MTLCFSFTVGKSLVHRGFKSHSYEEALATTAILQTKSNQPRSPSTLDKYDILSHRTTLSDSTAFEQVEGYDVLDASEPSTRCYTRYEGVEFHGSISDVQRSDQFHVYSTISEGDVSPETVTKTDKVVTSSMKSNPMYGGKLINHYEYEQ